MVLIVLAQFLIPEQRTAILLGLASLAAILLLYMLRRKIGRSPEEATNSASPREEVTVED